MSKLRFDIKEGHIFYKLLDKYHEAREATWYRDISSTKAYTYNPEGVTYFLHSVMRSLTKAEKESGKGWRNKWETDKSYIEGFTEEGLFEYLGGEEVENSFSHTYFKWENTLYRFDYYKADNSPEGWWGPIYIPEEKKEDV